MNDRPERSADEILEDMRRDAAQAYRLFSNDGKEERERWIVTEFLNRLSIGFPEGEIRSCEQQSKVDIQFRDANFQVKEITDPETRRAAEYRAMYRQVETAKTLQEASAPPFVYDTPPIVSGYELVRERAQILASKGTYTLEQRRSLDLLFYVTRTHASLIRVEDIRPQDFEQLHWRSVSCLMGHRSIVLFSQSNAPEFIRTFVASSS